MTGEDAGGNYRGARFTGADFTGVTLRDCDLRGAKVTDSWLMDVDLSGLVERLVVNDVDVTAFVEGELDRRHPERVQLRGLQTVEDYQALWSVIEDRWAETVERARLLPEPRRQERVDGEWSVIETLRHLVFVTDAWATRTIDDDPMPYHRLGLTHTAYPADHAAAIGIDLAARPSFDEVLAVRAERLGSLRRIVAGLTAAELARECPRAPAPGYPDEPRTVGGCLRVVMTEECEHLRYAIRDLAVLEGSTASSHRGGVRSSRN